MFTEIKKKLKALGIAPIFFVGSGISRRYLGSPNWEGLLKEITNGRKINFELCKQKYKLRGKIDFERLAEELESVYFDNLPEAEFEENGSRTYYFRKRICDIINKYLEQNEEVLEQNGEIRELKKANPSVIITTNYDELLEKIFGNDYTVHIGQESLLTNVLDGVGEIYKIHGSVTDPESIVITKNDYDNFFEKDSYLNAKLLTLFLEYPIVFLGYSISDRNVKSILTTIVKMLPQEKVEELRSRIWFVTGADTEEDEIGVERINLADGLYIDINSYKLNDFTEFYKSINDISINKLPIKFLKYLKNNTYKLIASQNYNSKLLNVNVAELEKIDDFNSVNNFVGLTFSTGEKKVCFKAEDICKAFINNKVEGYDGYSILDFKRNSKMIPFYKFIEGLKYDDILKHIEFDLGEESELYKIIENDDKNYIQNIGCNLDVSDYDGVISNEYISIYVLEYMKEKKLMKNQAGTVKKYILLRFLEEDIDNLISNEKFCQTNCNDLAKCISNLKEDYILKNKKKIESLMRIITKDEKFTIEIRKTLCLLDRVFYRREILKTK